MRVNIINRMDHVFAKQYGSRRGYIKTLKHRIYNVLGMYRHYQQIDWKNVDRLVFVCKGNICRSAYAEVVAKSLGVNAISCGVDTRNNFPANEKAISVASDRGFTLSAHRTTTIQAIDMRSSDLFVVMEPWQANLIIKKYGRDRKCTLLGLAGRPKNPHIQDPYGASVEYFNYCFSYIENSVHEISEKIRK